MGPSTFQESAGVWTTKEYSMGSGRPHEQGKKKTEEELALEAEQLIAAQKTAELKAQGNIEEAEKVAQILDEPEKEHETPHTKTAETKEGQEHPEEMGERELLKQAEAREKERKAHDVSEKQQTKSERVTKKAAPKKVSRSVRYLERIALVDRAKRYSVPEALELVKKTSYANFDPTVEVHIRVKTKGKKGNEEAQRGVVHLPHGTGKTPRVALASVELIEKVSTTKRADFDILIATPELMPALAKVAKILGPIGKMPNPKYGTVTQNPDELKKEIEAGRREWRADSGNNIHFPIGKLSFDEKKLTENLFAALAAVPVTKIASATLSATMGPGIPLEIAK